MYSVLKNVIMSGNFVLSDMYNKIDTMWIKGKITEEEKAELEAMLIEYQNPFTQAPELKELYMDLKARVEKLEEKVFPVEELELGEIVIEKGEPWDGVSNKYQFGAVVEHKGKCYQDMLESMQNTWEPGSVGVDERYWKEITKEETEAIIKGQREGTKGKGEED